MSNDDLLNMLNAAVAATPAAPAAPIAPTGSVDDIVAASMAMTADVTIPAMARPFHPHQAAAYLYCLGAIARFGGALLGDDMGMGKTQVILAMAADYLARTGKRPVIVAPPVTLAGYKGDLKACFPGLNLFHAKGRTAGPIPADADIIFISDDPLTLRAWLSDGLDARKNFVISALALDASIVIVDEIHRFKGADGKPQSPTSRARLITVLGRTLAQHNIPRVGMTGTLLTNGRPIEMVIPLQFVGGGTALIQAVTPGGNTIRSFADRYCAPTYNGYGWQYGCDRAALPTLHTLLRSTVYCRRDKDDLGDAMPARRWLVRPLALNGVLARYMRVERDVLGLIRDENGPEAYLRAARAEKLVQIMKLWEEAGAAKAAAAVEYIADLVDEGRQVVAFYNHTAVLSGLQDGLSKARIPTGLIAGNQSGPAREEQIARFQAGKDRVILANLSAAGIGVTLSAAADAVFVQIPWSSGILKQAADRIVRTDAITYARAARGEHITWHVLQACKENGDETFDGHMFRAVQAKAAASDAVNAGKEITMPDEDVMLAAVASWYAANA